jgi:hypothetical protein
VVLHVGRQGGLSAKEMLDGARDRRYFRRTQRAAKFDEIDADCVQLAQTGLAGAQVARFAEVKRLIVIRHSYNWRP